MPPKQRITRDMILDAAFAIARAEGIDRVTVRTVARRLDCSTQPVMYCFSTIDELRQEVFHRADQFHNEQLIGAGGRRSMTEIGAAYVRFAAKEKHLFRLLFQSDHFARQTLHDIISDESLRPIIDILSREEGLLPEKAKELFSVRFMAVHGMASMLANNSMIYDEEAVRRLLEHQFPSPAPMKKPLPSKYDPQARKERIDMSEPHQQAPRARDVITIDHLHKRFGDVRAVQDLSIRVKEGELFAFLGINGAGKSTTISILCGLLQKDEGKVSINGIDLDGGGERIKRDLGVVFQNSALDKALSVRENLKCRAALYGVTGKEFTARLGELAQRLDFADLLNRAVGKLSGGQRRRIDIARALIHQPGILIFDEPTTGLDPQTRKLIWDTVSALRKERKLTVFLTTHYMEEAADADYVVILDSGRIAAEGTPLMLKNTYTGDYITLYGVEKERVEALGLPYQAIRDAYRVAVPNTAAATELIVSRPELFADFEITKGKMDDVFLAVTGKKLMGGAKE